MKKSTTGTPERMARTLLVLTLVLLAAAPVAAAGRTRYCGDIGGLGITPQDITISGGKCRSARPLARLVSKVPDAPWHGCTKANRRTVYLVRPCIRKGHACRVTRWLEYSAVEITCRRDDRRVRWTLG